MRKFTLAALIAAAVVVPAAMTSPSRAQEEAPAIEPRARSLLDAMSRRLADAKAFSFNARTTYDVPTAHKTPIFLTTVSDVSFKRPASLRVATIGDGPASVFVADGKKIGRFDPAAGTLASKDAPQGIDALVRAAGENGLDLPFSDVLLEKPFGDLSKGLTSAFVVGQSRLVGGTLTNIVSVSDGTSHMQIWIGATDNLPRQMVVSESRDGQTTRNTVAYANWRMEPTLRDSQFSASAYGKARQVELKAVTPID
jgi:hypothetical protein